MAAHKDLKALCEGWRDRLSGATHAGQSQCADEFLAWFGWEDPVPVAIPGNVSQTSAVSYLLSRGGQAAVVAHMVMPGAVKAPAAILDRNLDFCETTRTLVNATRAMNVPYAFITDLSRAFLYDTYRDELLLSADTPAAIAEEFGGVLRHDTMQEGSLEDVRRNPRSHVARQLREWMQRWSATLESDWRAPEDLAWLALDRMVLLRYLVEQNAMKRAGWNLRDEVVAVLRHAMGRQPEGTGPMLTALFRALWEQWGAGLYKPEPRLEAILEQDAVAIPLMRDFGLLSRAKFQLLTILESFNYGEAAEKARVRMIPEENEERSHYLAKQTIATVDEARIELDIEDEGYRAIATWFDSLLATYLALGQEYEREASGEAAPTPAADLFAWSEADAKQPQAVADPYGHAMSHGLVVYCASPRQTRTARLMLCLHVVAKMRAAGSRIVRFPDIDACIQPRPRITETDRRRIYDPVNEAEWEAM
jgi:hypothetical protein